MPITTKIAPEQEQALLDYVAGGKGLIPLHCASYCFLNSPKYIELVGAQFQRHGTGTFRTILAEGEHPITRGFGGFESWDETYVHTKHNEKDRTVLEWRHEGGPQGALDLGPHARQGARLLHRLGPRSADLGQSRLSEPGRARHPLGRRRRSGRRAGVCRRRAGLGRQAESAARRLPHR